MEDWAWAWAPGHRASVRWVPDTQRWIGSCSCYRWLSPAYPWLDTLSDAFAAHLRNERVAPWTRATA